jgi:hypothetical protein
MKWHGAQLCLLGIVGGDGPLGVVVGGLDAGGVQFAAQPFDLGDGFGVITTRRQPRLESSRTAQMSDGALVSPGSGR